MGIYIHGDLALRSREESITAENLIATYESGADYIITIESEPKVYYSGFDSDVNYDEFNNEMQRLVDSLAVVRGEVVITTATYVCDEDADGSVWVFTSNQPQHSIMLCHIEKEVHRIFEETGSARIRIVPDTTWRAPKEAV